MALYAKISICLSPTSINVAHTNVSPSWKVPYTGPCELYRPRSEDRVGVERLAEEAPGKVLDTFVSWRGK